MSVKAGIKITVIIGLLGMACFSLMILSVHAQEDPPTEIKSDKTEITRFSATGFSDGIWPWSEPTVEKLELAKDTSNRYEPKRVFTSEAIPIASDKIQIFNAIAAHWQAAMPAKTSTKIEISTSDGLTWGTWQKFETDEILSGPRDDGETNLDDQSHFSNLIFTNNAGQFKYRITLTSSNPAVTPSLDEIIFTYIDSTAGPTAASDPSSSDPSSFEEPAFAGAPQVISRTGWGCPDGESSPGWTPQTATKTFQVYHHTATTNNLEPYSTMRAIWHYHAETRKWGDIGYNYLVDQYGHIFKGRAGPKNVIGAHVYRHNTRSIGVAVLGTYISSAPSSAAISGLSSILAYSSYLNEMSIKLYGHRELAATQCPGDAFFVKKSTIISQAKTKLAGYPDSHLLENNGDYYYLNGNNQVRKFANIQMVSDWGFDPDKKVSKTDEQLLAYVKIADMKSFAKYNDLYYLIALGKRYPIKDPKVKAHWQIDDTKAVDVSQDINLLTAKTSRGPHGQYLSRFMKAKGTDLIYLLENGLKRPVPTRVFEARNYSYSLVIGVSSIVTDLYPDGKILLYRTGTLIRVKNEVGIYYIQGDLKRRVYIDAFRYLGYNSKSVIPETQTFFDLIEMGNQLLQDPGKIIQIEKDGQQYQYWIRPGFKRRYIPHSTVFNAWNFTQDQIIEESYNIYKLYRFASTLFYPSGVLIRGDLKPSIYFIDLEQRRFISLSIFNAWGFAGWLSDQEKFIDNVPQSFVSSIPHAGNINFDDRTIMYVGVGGGDYQYYYVQDSKKRFMPSRDIYLAYHFKNNPKVQVSQALINVYPAGENLYYPSRMLIRGIGCNGVYYMESNQKRYISVAVFQSWKFDPHDIRDIPVNVLKMIPDGPNLGAKKLTSLLGPYGSPVRLPAYSGKVCREQHLYLNSAEAALGRTWASTKLHYKDSNVPLSVRLADGINDMAGGYGAFGSPASVSRERYYVNMRWGYGSDMTLKSWYRHKKLIVTYKATGKSVVVSIEEYGPAAWTTRVAGLSPEAMKAIGTECNDGGGEKGPSDVITYYWAGSQSLPLGPID